MISVAQAEAFVLRKVTVLPAEVVPLTGAGGRVLREVVRSDRDQPPFHKSLMDGIALSCADWEQGGRSFPVLGMIAAGEPARVVRGKQGCVRIMTGAVVPAAYDAVVPVEHVRIVGGEAVVDGALALKHGQFIRLRGQDVRKGDVVLREGLRLDPPAIGIAASVGKTRLKVARQARIAIVATGNELVDLGRPLQAHQTRLSNSYALAQLIDQSGLGVAQRFHLPDDKKTMTAALRKILVRHDVVVLSGGVSMGEKDFVPDVLAALGVEAVFHKVAQKPGKPLWFGRNRRGVAVFGLPGNPISTLMCAYRYVLPYVRKAAGLTVQKQGLDIKARPQGTFSPGMTYFLPVRDGQVVPTGGSGDWASLAGSDGFIEYDGNTQHMQRPYFSWRI